MSLVRAARRALRLLERGESERARRVLAWALADHDEALAAEQFARDNRHSLQAQAQHADKFEQFREAWRPEWRGLPATQVQAELDRLGIALDIKTIRKFLQHPFLQDDQC